jgi:predicted anti-sigma-YlaC factor YlaD
MLSDFLDNALNDYDHASVSLHLQECLRCYTVHAELAAIISLCGELRTARGTPPTLEHYGFGARNP